MMGVLFTHGCASELKIYIPKGSYTIFASDYFWGDYSYYLEERN
jgi:hypothetical protein